MPEFLDPDQLRQTGKRFPEALSGLAGAEEFIRAMDEAKTKAEIAFRRREAAENWNGPQEEEIEELIDRFSKFDTAYPWRPAACAYIWTMASTYLRSPFADCEPEMFEDLVNTVINVYAERVYEEKLKPYEKKEWTSYERSKAEFQEYVKSQLDPLVQGECLDKWQQRLAPDSNNPEGHNKARTKTDYVPRGRVGSLRVPLSLREPREYSREWAEEFCFWLRNELGKIIGADGNESTLVGDAADSSVASPSHSATARASVNPQPSEVDVARTQSELAAKRRAVIMPILKKLHWRRGKWATKAGVGKNSIYEYLDGTRNPSELNRKAMADALGLAAEDLPQ